MANTFGRVTTAGFAAGVLQIAWKLGVAAETRFDVDLKEYAPSRWQALQLIDSCSQGGQRFEVANLFPFSAPLGHMQVSHTFLRKVMLFVGLRDDKKAGDVTKGN